MPTKNFKVGEMLNKRSPNSKTWINFDGSYTTEIHSGLVHFEDENGNLQNINTDLYDEADFDLLDEPVAKEGAGRFKEAKKKCKEDKKKNKLNRDLYDFQGLKVPFDAKIPRNFKRGYTIGKGADKLTFKPVGSSPAKGDITPNECNCIHYQDAWNDTDVKLELTAEGIKETIILKSDRSPVKFRFEVEGNIDDLTELKLLPAWLEDANKETRDVEQIAIEENGKTFVELTANVEGLSYPIAIDPTVTLAQNLNIGDTFSQSSVKTANNGSSVNLMSGRDGNGEHYISYIKFDLSNFLGTAIISATVNLTFAAADANFSDPFRMDKPNSNWAENTLTWNNQPTTTNLGCTSRNIGNTTGVFPFDVKPITQMYADGAENMGYALIDVQKGISSRKYFYSKEVSTVSWRPTMTVNYSIPPTKPTVITPNGGETWNSLHRIEWLGGETSKELEIGKAEITTVSFGTNDVGQSFVVGGNWNIYEVGIVALTNIENHDRNLRLVEIDESFNIISVLSTKVTRITFTKEMHVLALSTPVKVPIGTKLAIHFTTGSAQIILARDNDVYSDGVMFYGSSKLTTNNDAISYVKYTDDNLQHNIQLTTNNGGSWKDIVSLTPQGATFHDYDFINEPETSTAKIRVRAYDGAIYSEWDESDGVFTIEHNQAPTKPTNLQPTGIIDKDKVQRLTWQFNDGDSGDSQSKYDLQWRVQGASTWNEISQETPNNYRDFAASTFPAAVIEWRVRTYDQAGLSSPYSDVVTFRAATKPNDAVVLSPADGSVVAVSRPLVQWSTPAQVEYHVRVLTAADAVIWQDQRVSTNRALTVGVDLDNETNYKIQIRIRTEAGGLWSDYTTSNIFVSFTPPKRAVLTFDYNQERGAITVNIENPAPSGTEPQVENNDIYRRENGGPFVRIGKGIATNGAFVDYEFKPGATVDYYVISFGNNGTVSQSLNYSTSGTVQFTQLAVTSNPGQWVTLQKGTKLNERQRVEATKTKFAGRAFAITEFGEGKENEFNYNYIVSVFNDLVMLQNIIDAQETIILRDARGRKAYVTIDRLGVEEKATHWQIDIKPEKMHYIEGV